MTGSFTFFLTLFALTDAAPVSTIAYLSNWVGNAGNYVEDDYILWENKLTERRGTLTE